MALTATNLRKQLVIHWEDYDRTLPTGKDSLSKLRRRDLFQEFDPNGNGILQQSSVVRALFRLFPRVVGIVDTRPLLNLCFRVARDTAPPIVPISVAGMDRNEFRVLLICLKCYLKAWEVWYNHFSNETAHDGLVRLEDIEVFRPLFDEWDLDNIDMMALRIQQDFRSLDAHSMGALQFDKFADSFLRRCLPFLSQDDEEAEQDEAKRLLKQTHAHLFLTDDEAPKPGARHFGGVTRALGMRPNARSRMMEVRPDSSAAFDGSVTRYVKDQGKGWSAQVHSQYRHDFASPKYTAAQIAAAMPKSPSVPTLKRNIRQVGLTRNQATMDEAKSTRYNLSRFMLHQSKSDAAIPTSQTALHALEKDRAERSGLAAAGALISSPMKRKGF